jgi:hypothetical protein
LVVDVSADPADLIRPIIGEVLFAHLDNPLPATVG